MLLLAFDTATPAIAVALHDGSRVLAAESVVDARRHGELLAAGIDKVLRAAGASRGDLTELAVGTGPGPYTGLRAGVMTANVLASALDLPVHGVCSLDVIAADAEAPGDFLVATDARRREVYWALYGGKGMRRAGPFVTRPAEVPAGYPVAGEAAVLYPELGTSLPPRYPSAARLAELAIAQGADGLPPREAPRTPLSAGLAEPIYLRRPDARQPGPRKRVTAPPPVRQPGGPQ